MTNVCAISGMGHVVHDGPTAADQVVVESQRIHAAELQAVSPADQALGECDELHLQRSQQALEIGREMRRTRSSFKTADSKSAL
jgi:hypothetical protein